MTKFARLISCVLSCFDRVIFKGYLPWCRVSEEVITDVKTERQPGARLANLTEPKRQGSRNSTGFNPARNADQQLFAALLAGDHLPQGCRNADIRSKVVRSAKTQAERRRASAAVSRLWKRFHVRGLIAKIPRTRRWKVTDPSRRVLGHALQLYRRDWTATGTTPAI